MTRLRRIALSTLSGIGLPIVLLIAWAIVPLFTGNRFFPPLSKVLNAFVATWLNQSFLVDVVPSLTRLAIGIIVSIVLGIALGILIGSFRPLRSLLEPVLEFFRAIPPPVLIPVLLLLMGITDEMKIAVIVSGSVWPVLLNTIEGVRAVDPVMRETAQSYRIGRRDRLTRLVLPAAAPQIMTGIRQCLSVALILMVISEMAKTGSSSGLGYRISYFQTNYLIAEMWSGIVLLGLIGIALSLIFQVAERFILNWYHGLKEVERA
ncbi:MAG: ABC transporter permease [Pseudolysinimonas sp.]|uniref:ABC transporter permease n=1 Tax=Pseudolysinimonas sp. TaxID=2680009 RepID=UPI00326777BD